jgi:hypothetical protein
MIRQTHLRDRGTLTFLTLALTSLLVACGSDENSSPEIAAPGNSATDTMADNTAPESEDRTASLTLGDETIVFTVEMCVNPGGGTFTFTGSTSKEDGKTVDIMVRGISGQNQAFITIGPRGSSDAWEWRGGTKTTTASIDGGVLTASGEAVGLDPSTNSSTDQTMTFSVEGPCLGLDIEDF